MKKAFECALALSLALISAMAWADSLTATVVAYDRVAKRIVLADKSVLELGSTEVPASLDAGDEVQIDFEGAGESGFGKITAISIVKEGN